MMRASNDDGESWPWPSNFPDMQKKEREEKRKLSKSFFERKHAERMKRPAFKEAFEQAAEEERKRRDAERMRRLPDGVNWVGIKDGELLKRPAWQYILEGRWSFIGSRPFGGRQ